MLKHLENLQVKETVPLTTTLISPFQTAVSQVRQSGTHQTCSNSLSSSPPPT